MAGFGVFVVTSYLVYTEADKFGDDIYIDKKNVERIPLAGFEVFNRL